MDWSAEICELHECFEAYFLGTTSGLDRVEAALGPDFTFVGPNGIEAPRSAVLDQIRSGHAHTQTLKIEIEGARLVRETDDLVVARYEEVHHLHDRSNRRVSTVVFDKDPAGPNGLRWRHVQETFVQDPTAVEQPPPTNR